MASSGPKKPDFHAFVFDDPPVGSAHYDINPVQVSINLETEPLDRDERGLVIGPPFKPTTDGGVVTDGRLDPQELRFSLLLWDRLSRFDNNLVSVGPTADEDFLIKAGILTRPRVIFSGKRMTTDHVLAAQKVGFMALDGREPGLWSLGKSEGAVSFGPAELKPNAGILLSLYEAIPVPDKDVPLDELLDFKLKRRAELLALRHHLERVYQTILGAADVHQAIVTELAALDLAIADQLKVSRESRLKFKLSGLVAKLDYKTWAGGATAFTLAGHSMPTSAAILAGMAGAAVASISATASVERRTKTATPFEYISSFHRELF